MNDFQIANFKSLLIKVLHIKKSVYLEKEKSILEEVESIFYNYLETAI